MLTPQQKEWCHQLQIDMNLLYGVQVLLYSKLLHEGFLIDLN
jgi:hypothetical protein